MYKAAEVYEAVAARPRCATWTPRRSSVPSWMRQHRRFGSLRTETRLFTKTALTSANTLTSEEAASVNSRTRHLMVFRRDVTRPEGETNR